MGRLAALFARARAEKRTPLVIYLTASDPDRETSHRLMQGAIDAGADIVELGVPWSDPSADGPAIAAAMYRALKSGGGLRSTLDLCGKLRAANPDVGIVLFGYANPLVAMGVPAFAAAAHARGADGVLCVDWPADEDLELASALRSQDMDLIPLLAPTSNLDRIRTVAAQAGGFLYYVSLTGITGRQIVDFTGPRHQLEQIRALTDHRLPVVVGFGIKTPEDAAQVAEFADGVVVGSAAVQVVETAVKAGQDPVPVLVSYVQSLKRALQR